MLLGKIYRIDSVGYPIGKYRIVFDNFGGQTTEGKESCFTSSTKEEFDKQNSKKETMRTITHTQAQEIIDVACSTWKDKLFEKWGKSIVLRKSIFITEHEYQEMRKACTSDQNELFDEIFGKDAKFKVGDWMIITQRGVKRENETFQLTKDMIITDSNIYHIRYKNDGYMFPSQVRLMTEEEIQKAKYIPKGTPCLVRDFNNETWKFAYSLGNGKFQSMSGVDLSWSQVQVLDINNLPKY